jgi:hypothetical protein
MLMTILSVIALVGGIAMTCCATADEDVNSSTNETIQQIQEENRGELGW